MGIVFSVLLTILKAILIMLLALVLLVLILLFIPITYRAGIIKEEDTTDVRAKVSYLFRLFSLKIRYTGEEGTDTDLLIAGRSLAERRARKLEKKKEKRRKERRRKIEAEKAKDPVAFEERQAKLREERERRKKEAEQRIAEEKKRFEEEEAALRKKKEVAFAKKTTFGGRIRKRAGFGAEGLKARTVSLLRQLRFRLLGFAGSLRNVMLTLVLLPATLVCRFFDTWSGISRTREKLREWKWFLTHERTLRLAGKVKRLVIRLVKYVAPRKAEGNVKAGFSDPSTTGMVSAVYYGWTAMHPNKFSFDPVFDRQVMEADVRLKGKIRLGRILLWLVPILVSRDFWFVYRYLKKKRNEDTGEEEISGSVEPGEEVA